MHQYQNNIVIKNSSRILHFQAFLEKQTTDNKLYLQRTLIYFNELRNLAY